MNLSHFRRWKHAGLLDTWYLIEIFNWFIRMFRKTCHQSGWKDDQRAYFIHWCSERSMDSKKLWKMNVCVVFVHQNGRTIIQTISSHGELFEITLTSYFLFIVSISSYSWRIPKLVLSQYCWQTIQTKKNPRTLLNMKTVEDNIKIRLAK